MAVNLDSLMINVIVGIVVVSPVLWLAGRWLVGSDKARFIDAIWIVFLGTAINAIIGALLPGLGLLAAIIMFVIWLALVKKFFDCGWVMAFAISLIAVIIIVIVGVILGIIGLALFTT